MLRRCGLISQRAEGQRRPCRLNVDRLAAAEGWLGEQRREWNDRLDALEAHLAGSVAAAEAEKP